LTACALPSTARDVRDYAMVAMLIGCGLRRAELLACALSRSSNGRSTGSSPTWSARLMSPEIRRAITVDARVKPNYAGIRVPVLAMYQAQRPFGEVAAEFDIRNEQERAALRQQYAATRAMYTRWQQDLLAAVPTARIVELPGASLFMFLSNEADVLREIRAFADTLTGR
jgi:hypothetical protein